MKQKTLIAISLILLLITSSTPFFLLKTASSAVVPKFYVDDDYNITTPGWGVDHFSSIQPAINNASLGDRIIVYNGTYIGCLTINKKIDLFGENQATTVINGNQTRSVIIISANYVNISHFTIRNSKRNETSAVIRITSSNVILTDNAIQEGYHGIYITNGNTHLIYDNIIRNNNGDGIRCNQSDDNTIAFNTITNNSNGVLLYSCEETALHNNSITSNDANGVFLNDTCSTNTIRDNTIASNDENGVFLLNYCSTNTISNNELYTNIGTGVRIENSSSNSIHNNDIYSNYQYGFLVTGSSNIIWNNTIFSNQRHGMFLFADDHTMITGNNIRENTYEGIRSYNSTSDTIRNNTIFSNGRYGIYLDFFTFQNRIYNNKIFSNTQQNALDKTTAGRNIWNTSKTQEQNIINGSFLGGNYWDDYTGLDPDGDGLGNTSYSIEISAFDYLPLIDVTPPSIGGVQTIPSVQTTQGYLNISATVTDDLRITDVRLMITNPNNQQTNFSILVNKTGNIYYCRKSYSVVGLYTFQVLATDSRHWVSTLNLTFIIQPGIPPTIEDYSSQSGEPNSRFTFNVSVTDDTDPAALLTVKANWKHGKNGGNDTLVHVRNNYFENTVRLDKSIANMTYTIYARDYWGNEVVSTQKSVTIYDNKSPIIVVTTYGPSFDVLPNSFTFGALITDDVEVSQVSLEYWYEGSTHLVTEMNKKNSTYYEKVIIPTGTPERVYCIINANDTSGNHNDTTHPFPVTTADIYHGVVTIPIMFNANASFDLDGNITTYEWDFGDGTTGNGSTPLHTYSANGTYMVTLTITDDDGNTGVLSVTANVISLVKKLPSSQTFQKVQQDYNLALLELFYCYDTDGDMIEDTFVDPNGVLIAVHNGHLNLSGNISFLISVNDTVLPEFFWNITKDTIVSIRYRIGKVNYTLLNGEENNATVFVLVNKTNGWMFLEVPDAYPQANLTVRTEERTIASERVWRKNGKVYVFDDPDTEYMFLYQEIIQVPVLAEPSFDPVDGGVINENQPTITITYTVPVVVLNAKFGDLVISPAEILTTDDKVFTYTPPSTLVDDTYLFIITVGDDEGNTLESSVIYFYFAYTVASEETGFSIPFTWIGIGGILAAGIIVFFLLRTKHISVNEFIYFKNRKIIPFVKTLVIGPVSVQIDDTRINKAEFYIDGILKETLTKPPFYWNWNEPAFFKHTLETKIYDSEGNTSSSGEKKLYIFNPAVSHFYKGAGEKP